MLLNSKIKKLVLCAPSNAAIDEIITRLATRGLMGSPKIFSKDEKVKDSLEISRIMVRLGAMEYEPSPVVKAYTVDSRVESELLRSKIYSLE